MDPSDLLLLRLHTLRQDIRRVRAAVDRAKRRSHNLSDAFDAIMPAHKKLSAIQVNLTGLFKSMQEQDESWREDDDEELDDLLSRMSLKANLLLVPDLLDDVAKSVKRAVECLRAAKETSTGIDLPSMHESLERSLERSCEDVASKITALETAVRSSDPDSRPGQWATYQQLLDNEARPVFVEYVDFLGGLTVRETGLDDRVCDMTSELLTRFNSVTPRTLTLPLPARHAALGSALDGLVMLGFPEWSIWGIPLVGHEIGLGYVRDPMNPAWFADIVDRFADKTPICDRPTEEREANAREYLAQLVADCFATYILGFAYACACMLLRLVPRHDEPAHHTRPRDLDRARVIMMTLTADTGPEGGATFSDAVYTLKGIWMSAVEACAGPDMAVRALEEAAGLPPQRDWLDDFTELTLRHFASRQLILAYDTDRWRSSDAWCRSLPAVDKDDPPKHVWSPKGAAVADVLTAAWRLRLMEQAEPEGLASQVLASWSSRKKGGA